MAAQGNLTLNTKLYAPRGKTGDISKWSLVGDASFGGAISSVTESVRDPSGKDTSYRVRFHLDVPKAATADSACGCAGSIQSKASADIYVVIPGDFTAAERTDLQLRIANLVASSVFTSAVKDLEGSW